MAVIVAGLFKTIAETEAVRESLLAADVESGDISIFILNPLGQHALYPIGGDEDADCGASRADSGAVSGVVIGASAGLGIGAAAVAAAGMAPIAAVAAAAAGAYAGSLVGALNNLGDSPSEPSQSGEITRPAGPMVAMLASNASAMQRAIAIMQRHGAIQIERAEGLWQAGQWADFDPRIPPSLVHTNSPDELPAPATHTA